MALPGVLMGSPDTKVDKNGDGRALRSVLVATVIGCAVLALVPLLSSGYYSDDLMNSAIKGRTELEGISLAAHLFEEIRNWVVDNGRIHPVFILENVLFSYFLTDLTIHKSAVLLLVIVDLLLFFKMLEMLTKDFYAACLGVLLLPVLFQFRLYHDPILSFSGGLPCFMALVLLSIVAFQTYLAVNRRGYLVASLIAYNLSLYFYEISLPLVLLFPVLAAENGLFREIRSTFRRTLPYLVSFGCAFGINLLVRSLCCSRSAGYAGIQMNLETLAVAKSFVKQLSATMPLSYFIFDPAHLFRGVKQSGISVAAMLPVIAFASTYWYLTRRMAGARNHKLLLMGATLLFFPALMISLSLKYQHELQPGLGYLPVYVQYFGLALVALWSLLLLHRELSPWWRFTVHVAVCVGLSFCLLRTIQNNWAVVDQANIDLHYRRAALVTALQEGILGEVAEHANLLIVDGYSYVPRPEVSSPLRGWGEQGYPWKNAGLVYQYTGKRFTVFNSPGELAKLVSGEAAAGEAERSAYLLNIHSFPDEMHRKEGYVVLSKIDDITVDARGDVQFRTLPLKTISSESSRTGQ
jgi:hypothetical protein